MCISGSAKERSGSSEHGNKDKTQPDLLNSNFKELLVNDEIEEVVIQIQNTDCQCGLPESFFTFGKLLFQNFSKVFFTFEKLQITYLNSVFNYTLFSGRGFLLLFCQLNGFIRIHNSTT